MAKLNTGSGFAVKVPKTYREYKDLIDLLTSNGVIVDEELYYHPDIYPDSEQTEEWYQQNHSAYRADYWIYFGVVERGGELVTHLSSDTAVNYLKRYASVEDMVQERAEKPEQGVDLSDRIEGFDAYEVTLSVGNKTVSFTSASQAELGNKTNDPIPALTCLRTLEQVEEALKDDSVTILWGLGSDGVLIRPNHLSRESKLVQVATMMKQGVYVAAKK